MTVKDQRFIGKYLANKGWEIEAVILFYPGIVTYKSLIAREPDSHSVGVRIDGVHLVRIRNPAEGFEINGKGSLRPWNGLVIPGLGMEPDVFIFVFYNAENRF